MALRPTIHAALLASTGVTDLIGTGDACRHYAGRVPQAPGMPFVVSIEIASSANDTHGNTTDAEDTLDETLVQFSCYAETLAAALALRGAVRAALLDPTISASHTVLTTANVVVTGPDTREQYEPEVDLHCAQLDLTFFHNPNT